jgi:uncharacterized DUF497 family protein
VVRWEQFDAAEYEISFNEDKLAAHGISAYDAMEVLMNGVHVIRNKRVANRYRVRGRTNAGRALELIIIVEGNRRLRCITRLESMTSRKRKLLDDQIEAEVLADLHDPSAWKEPIFVPPSKSPLPEWVTLGRHLELSARFHVLSVLHRLGAEASMTNAYRDNVDITVVHAPGRALTIDVKTLNGTNKWRVQPFSSRKHHYVAFVVYVRKAMNDQSAAPDVLIFPSGQLKASIDRHETPVVNIPSLARELGISDSWQQLIVEAA